MGESKQLQLLRVAKWHLADELDKARVWERKCKMHVQKNEGLLARGYVMGIEDAYTYIRKMYDHAGGEY